MKVRMGLAIPAVALIVLVACGNETPPAGPAQSPTSPAATETAEPTMVAHHFRAALKALDAGKLASARKHTEEGHELAHEQGLDEAADLGDEALEALDAGNRDKARKHIKAALEASQS